MFERMKKPLSILLTACILAGVCPAVADESPAPLTVSGGREGTHWVWKEDTLTILRGGTYTLSPAEEAGTSANIDAAGADGPVTLTLSGLRGVETLSLPETANVILRGESAVSSLRGEDCALTLRGDGTLSGGALSVRSLTVDDGAALSVEGVETGGDLRLEAGSLTAASPDGADGSGISCGGDLLVGKDGLLTADGWRYGVLCDGGVTVTGILRAEARGPEGVGLCCGGDLTVNSGEITTLSVGREGGVSCASVQGEVLLSQGSSVELRGGARTGLVCGRLALEDACLYVRPEGTLPVVGLSCQSIEAAEGGLLYLTGTESAAIWVEEPSLSDGTVLLTGGTAGAPESRLTPPRTDSPSGEGSPVDEPLDGGEGSPVGEPIVGGEVAPVDAPSVNGEDTGSPTPGSEPVRTLEITNAEHILRASGVEGEDYDWYLRTLTLYRTGLTVSMAPGVPFSQEQIRAAEGLNPVSLTLNGVNIQSQNDCLCVEGPLSLTLRGENFLESEQGVALTAAAITLEGSGSLMSCVRESGKGLLCTSGDLTLKGASLITQGTAVGIDCGRGTVSLQNNAVLLTAGDRYGMICGTCSVESGTVTVASQGEVGLACGKLLVGEEGSAYCSGRTYALLSEEKIADGDLIVLGSEEYQAGEETLLRVAQEQTEKGSHTFCLPGGSVARTMVLSGGITHQWYECGKDVACPVYHFIDANPQEWYHDGVHYCLENGMMNGTGGEKFKPANPVTRAQMVTILWRLAGEVQANLILPFQDVEEGQWYTEAIRWAAAAGLVTGITETSFAPTNPVTREQMATLLFRYAGLQGVVTDNVPEDAIQSFPDWQSVQDYAVAGMGFCVANEIIQGNEYKLLDAQGSATRAQAATMLMRFCEQTARTSGSPSPMAAVWSALLAGRG